MKRWLLGFTLLELLIVISIIIVLTMIGYPIYTQHLIKVRRQQAQIQLSQLASQLEQYFSLEGTYANASNAVNLAALNYNKSYRIKIKKATDSNFLISAIPKPKQAKIDKACGTLSEDEQGDHYISGYSSAQKCWV